MSMTRSDLPRVNALPDHGAAAIEAMWQAWAKAEYKELVGCPCPVSFVATFAEMLEATLEALNG
jgi:hypothetical protein